MTIVSNTYLSSYESIPDTWVKAPLENLVTLKKGKKPSNLNEKPWNDALPYIDIEAFEKGKIRKYAEPSSSTPVYPGDIVIVWDGARCGYVGKAPQKGALGSTLAAIEPILVHPDYIFRFLQSIYQIINSNPRGIGIPHIEPDLFWSLEVPLAPLVEQKRIAAKVEELITRVIATKQRLAKVPVILKRFREAVLTAAFSGYLIGEPEAEISIKLGALGEGVIEMKNGLSRRPVGKEEGPIVLRLADVSGELLV